METPIVGIERNQYIRPGVLPYRSIFLLLILSFVASFSASAKRKTWQKELALQLYGRAAIYGYEDGFRGGGDRNFFGTELLYRQEKNDLRLRSSFYHHRDKDLSVRVSVSPWAPDETSYDFIHYRNNQSQLGLGIEHVLSEGKFNPYIGMEVVGMYGFSESRIESTFISSNGYSYDGLGWSWAFRTLGFGAQPVAGFTYALSKRLRLGYELSASVVRNQNKNMYKSPDHLSTSYTWSVQWYFAPCRMIYISVLL